MVFNIILADFVVKGYGLNARNPDQRSASAGISQAAAIVHIYPQKLDGNNRFWVLSPPAPEKMMFFIKKRRGKKQNP